MRKSIATSHYHPAKTLVNTAHFQHIEPLLIYSDNLIRHRLSPLSPRIL